MVSTSLSSRSRLVKLSNHIHRQTDRQTDTKHMQAHASTRKHTHTHHNTTQHNTTGGVNQCQLFNTLRNLSCKARTQEPPSSGCPRHRQSRPPAQKNHCCCSRKGNQQRRTSGEHLMEREQGQQQDMCQEWRTCIFEVIIIHCFASTAGSIRPKRKRAKLPSERVSVIREGKKNQEDRKRGHRAKLQHQGKSTSTQCSNPQNQHIVQKPKR